MPIWSSEIKELEKLYESFKGQLPDLEKELGKLIKADDENMILLYSRRCLEVIITDLCDCELKRERGTEPLKGIIDKLHKERKVPPHILTSMHGLNELSNYGAHPKDFDPEQVKPVLNNLDIIIKWYLKYKETRTENKIGTVEEIRQEIKSTGDVKKNIMVPKKRLTWILSGLIVLIVIMIAVLLFTDIIGNGKQIKELEKSIAVLPFKNNSPSDTNTYFINGIMEKVLNNLQMIKDLRVIPRTSVEQYRNTIKTIREIAKELGVNYIIEGSGQKYGNRFSLSVKLIGAAKENHLWGHPYEQEIKDVYDFFNVQSQIAQAIAAELKAVITPEEKQIIEKVSTSNMVALDLYLKADNYLREYKKTLELSSYQTAVNLYKYALELDSSFAKAYTGLASAFYERYQWETYFEKNYLDSMLVLLDEALSLDNQLDEAFYLKGIYYSQMGEHIKALNSFDFALKYNPNYFEAYLGRGDILTWYSADFIKCIDNYINALNLCRSDKRPSLLRKLGFTYLNIGFPEKAKQFYSEAYSIDSSQIYRLVELAMFAFYSGNIEEGLNIQRKTVEADSTFFPMELMMIGEKEEAYLLAKRLNDYSKKKGELNLNFSHRIGYAFDRVGKNEEARTYFDQQIKFSEESIRLKRQLSKWGAAQYDLAATYAYLGEKGKAYKYLEECSKKDDLSLWWILMVKTDPLFDKIRNKPEFKQILAEMEAKYQAEHERVRKWLEEQGML